VKAPHRESKKEKSNLLLAVNVRLFLFVFKETSGSSHPTLSSSTREAECNEMTSKESQIKASETQEVTISINNYVIGQLY